MAAAAAAFLFLGDDDDVGELPSSLVMMFSLVSTLIREAAEDEFGGGLLTVASRGCS